MKMFSAMLATLIVFATSSAHAQAEPETVCMTVDVTTYKCETSGKCTGNEAQLSEIEVVLDHCSGDFCTGSWQDTSRVEDFSVIADVSITSSVQDEDGKKYSMGVMLYRTDFTDYHSVFVDLGEQPTVRNTVLLNGPMYSESDAAYGSYIRFESGCASTMVP